MMVRTTRKCYINARLYEVGQTFEFAGGKLPAWIVPLDPQAVAVSPAAASPAPVLPPQGPSKSRKPAADDSI